MSETHVVDSVTARARARMTARDVLSSTWAQETSTTQPGSEISFQNFTFIYRHNRLPRVCNVYLYSYTCTHELYTCSAPVHARRVEAAISEGAIDIYTAWI
jgi:hypothetical protein